MAQEPLGMEGTYPLPRLLDRFLLKVQVPFPTADELVDVLERTTGDARPQVRAVAGAATLAAMIELTRQVPVPSHVLRHAVDLVLATAPGRSGAPARRRPLRALRCVIKRSAQALVLAGKVRALLDGRPNVSIDDVRATAPGAAAPDGARGTRRAPTEWTPTGSWPTCRRPGPTAGLRGAP
ncbi:MAG: hypothetical protein R2713_11890 [Ilumatobacteraceae bacterium]